MATSNKPGDDRADQPNAPRQLQLRRLRQRLIALVIAGIGSAALQQPDRGGARRSHDRGG